MNRKMHDFPTPDRKTVKSTATHRLVWEMITLSPTGARAWVGGGSRFTKNTLLELEFIRARDGARLLTYFCQYLNAVEHCLV